MLAFGNLTKTSYKVSSTAHYLGFLMYKKLLLFTSLLVCTPLLATRTLRHYVPYAGGHVINGNSDLEWSRDGRICAQAASTKIHLYRRSAQTPFQIIDISDDDEAGFYQVFRCRLSSQGTKLASCWHDRLYVHDIATREVLFHNFHGSTHKGLRDAVWSPGDARLLSIGYDGRAIVWDVEAERKIAVLEGHISTILSGAFSFNDTLVATASCDGTLRIWDATTGRGVSVLDHGDTWVISACFSHDGTKIASVTRDGTVRIWQQSYSGTWHVTVLNCVSQNPDLLFSTDDTLLMTIDKSTTTPRNEVVQSHETTTGQ